MSVSVYIAQSLDGYIADKYGGVEWLQDIPNPENSDFGFAEFLAGIDAVVMGRNTFEQVRSFSSWPYTKPVFVVSRSLAELPQHYAGKAQLLNLPPRAILAQLQKDGLRELYVDGGALIQSFLGEDLIDRLILTTLPILLGGGFPLFGGLDIPLKFELQKSEVLGGTLVKSYYSRTR